MVAFCISPREFRSGATKCEVALMLIKEDTQKNLLEGHITEEQFALIDKRIEEYLKEVRKLMNTEQ